MIRSYAIGDIHGQLKKLEEAHARIAADRARTGDAAAPVVHLGDLVDRGPDSRGVIARLRAGLAEGAPWVVLKGNHDALFVEFLDHRPERGAGGRLAVSWLHPGVGGATTLASYGVAHPGDRPVRPVHAEALERVPAGDRAFLAALPLMHRRGPVLFAHAGIRPGVPLDAQVEDDLIWIRQPFLSDTRDHGVLVVHGHTAVDEPMHCGNRVNIDSRAGYGGPLTAVVIEDRTVHILTEDGRVPLTPP